MARHRDVEPYETILADEDADGTARQARPGGNSSATTARPATARDGQGGANYPDLTDERLAMGRGPRRRSSRRCGLASTPHPNARIGQMPAFGPRRDPRPQRRSRTSAPTCYSLSDPGGIRRPGIIERIKAGREVFLTHAVRPATARTRKGNREVGAPNLTDRPLGLRRRPPDHHRLRCMAGGRVTCRHWDERLTPAEIKILSLYVASLGTKRP